MVFNVFFPFNVHSNINNRFIYDFNGLSDDFGSVLGSISCPFTDVAARSAARLGYSKGSRIICNWVGVHIQQGGESRPRGRDGYIIVYTSNPSLSVQFANQVGDLVFFGGQKTVQK